MWKVHFCLSFLRLSIYIIIIKKFKIVNDSWLVGRPVGYGGLVEKERRRRRERKKRLPTTTLDIYTGKYRMKA